MTVIKNEDINKISPQNLQQMLREDKDLILIDVLLDDHFNNVHIPKAKNVCVFEVAFLENIMNITSEKSDKIILYGSSNKSMDSFTAAEKLLREGFKQVFVLDGGLKGWNELGYELEGENTHIVQNEAQSQSLQDWNYAVDTEQSIIGWTGRNPNSTHHGTLRLSSGEIIVKDGNIRGKFDIDMKTIENINLEGDPLQPVLINHLMSDDFFFVKLFPKATFTMESAKYITESSLSEPNFEVEGILEMRGIQKKIQFLANASGEQGEEVKIESHFDFDRTQWGVIYGSTRFFEHLGMHIVFDLISIQLRLVAR